MSFRLLLAAFAAVLALPGCGGGGGSSGRSVTVTLEATAALTGTVWATGRIDAGVAFVVGDRGTPGEPPVGLRSFLSFDLEGAGIPAAATVESAVLTVSLTFESGTPTVLGALLVDQVVYGSVLDSGAYSRTFPQNQGMGPLDLSTTLGTKLVNVTLAVQECLLAARAQAQFRLRFQIETDGDTEHDQLAGFLSNNPPQLLVTYRP